MFRETKRAVPTVTAETVLAQYTVFQGKLKSQGSMRFDGELEGELAVEGDVVVGEHGRVRGNIKASNVIVAGTVHGNVDSKGRLEILSTGRLHGDISVNSLIIDEGGILQGKSAVLASGSSVAEVIAIAEGASA